MFGMKWLRELLRRTRPAPVLIHRVDVPGRPEVMAEIKASIETKSLPVEATQSPPSVVVGTRSTILRDFFNEPLMGPDQGVTPARPKVAKGKKKGKKGKKPQAKKASNEAMVRAYSGRHEEGSEPQK
jgi:hypothetical protein